MQTIESGQDVTALMGAAPPVPAPKSGDDVTALMTPTFQSTNAKDASGNAEVDPNTAGTFFRHLASQINPVTIAKGFAGLFAPMRSRPGLAGNALGDSHDLPLVKAIQQGVFPTDVLLKAKDSFEKEDYGGAAAHLIHYLIPVIGPALETPAEEFRQGKAAAGLGDTVGFATAMFAPEAALSKFSGLSTRPILKNPNALDRAAVAFGEKEGIPIDAATATGNRYVRTVQKTAEESLAGGAVGQRARATQDAALDATGHRLADQSFPKSVTQEGAGNAISDALTTKQQAHEAYANTAYDRLRAMEANPINGEYVSVDVTPAAKARMRATLGEIPSAEDIQGLRQIREELRALPYQPGKLIEERAIGGELKQVYTPRQAGAKVYHDITQASGSSLDRGEIEASVHRAIETGNFTAASKAALEVARKRVSDPYAVSKPLLEADAGSKTQGMLMPVDLRAAKAELGPIYVQLMREKDIAPLMGARGRALVALDRLMRSPDYAPVSIVDAALGDLKALDRATTGPGQGVVKQAVKNVDAAVQLAVAKAGPAAMRALRDGRAATVAKYQTADVLELLKQEPVKAYQQMTAPKDGGIDLLRTVQREVPQAMPDVARAYLDDLLNRATSEGGFKHTDKLWGDWQKLGKETKKALFPKKGQTEALDHFFLLSKRIGDNPNPSGSGYHVAKTGELVLLFTHPAAGVPLTISGATLAKLLHSPTVVRALTQGLQVTKAKTSPAIYTTAISGILRAATEAGVTVPAIADQERQK